MAKSTLLYALIILLIVPATFTGQQYLKYTHDGIERDYILYLPNNLPDDAPLVFMLHGYSGSAYSMMNYCGMNEVADINKFAVCYPRGTKDESGNNFWQVGYEFHQDEEVDDLGFITSLADYLQKNYHLSSQFTYCSGMSNGGDMSYMLACQASETFSASAPVAGCMMKWIYDSCEPEIRRPIFAINGTDDNITWWDGDIDNTDGWGAYMGVLDAIEFWSDLHNTSQMKTDDLPDIDPDDGSFIVSEKYIKGDNNNEVWLYKIVDGGHDWPGAWGNMDINTSEEVWGFFEMVMENSISDINSPEVDFGNPWFYPNPGSSTLTINTQQQSPGKYWIYNLSGKLMLTGKTNQNKIQIDISYLTNGLYMLKLDDKVYKLVKSD